LRSIAGTFELDAAKRHDAALAAHGGEERFGHELAVRHAAEGDVGNVVRIVVPGCRSSGLFHCVTTWAPAALQASTSARASGLSLGST
jgi:hypothetical protein